NEERKQTRRRPRKPTGEKRGDQASGTGDGGTNNEAKGGASTPRTRTAAGGAKERTGLPKNPAAQQRGGRRSQSGGSTREMSERKPQDRDKEYESSSKDDRKLKVIALGGMGEIGKNMFAFEVGDEILLVDGGLAFPDAEMLGVDI